jgi:hypothetical protein
MDILCANADGKSYQACFYVPHLVQRRCESDKLSRKKEVKQTNVAVCGRPSVSWKLGTFMLVMYAQSSANFGVYRLKCSVFESQIYHCLTEVDKLFAILPGATALRDCC